MSNKTRKYAWPASAAMAFALVAALAAFIVLASTPDAAIAHDPGTDHTADCADNLDLIVHDATADNQGQTNADGSAHSCENPGDDGNGNGNGSDDNRGSARKPSAPAMMSISRATDPQARPVLPGDGKLTIKWSYANDGGTPITGYDVRYTMTPADDDSWNSVNNLPAGKTSYVIMGLSNGETYYVQVRAKNRLGNSPWSSRSSGMPIAVPSAPMSLSVAGSESRVVVSWDAPASGGDHPIDQYNWDVDDTSDGGRSSSGTFGSRALRDPTPPRNQMFYPNLGGAITTSVASGGEGCLEVTVSASNATDDDPDGRTRSLPGDEAMVTCAGAPTLTKQIVDNVAILRWNEPSLGGGTEVTEYVVRRWGYERINPTDTDKLGNLLGPETREWHLGGSERVLWDTGLSHQTGYIYTIYAITDRYNLGHQPDRYNVSRRVTVFTSTDGGLILAPPTPPSAPRNLEAMDQCADQISLSWDEPSDLGGGVNYNLNRHWNHGMIVVEDDATIKSYQAQYRERGTSSWMNLTVTGKGAVLTSGLEFGNTYDFRVRAMNDIGLYGPWAMVSKTLRTPPEAQVPTSPDADPSPDNPAHVLFTWDPPGTAAGTATWRTVADVGADNMSKSMSYEIQRQRVGTSTWMTLPMAGATKKHQYLESAATAAEAIDNIQTQEFVDENVPATGAYKYRVRALIDECQPSEWAVTAEEVTVTLELGNASGLTPVASTVPGVVNLNWTSAPNATVHWLAGIKQSDWDAGNYGNIIWTQTQGMSSHVLTGLDSGDEYVFTVIGGTSLNGPWSSWTPLMRVTPN